MESSQQYEIVLDDKYGLIDKLGSGLTSYVYLGKDLNTSEKLALKIIKIPTPSFDIEVKALSHVSSPNVIQLKSHGTGVISRKYFGETEPMNYLALEYAENGELFEYLAYPGKGFGERFSRKIFKDILNGISAVHSNGFSHRDIKLENIMLGSNFEIKVADFGFAKLIPEDGKLSTPLGTLSYAAPEILMSKFKPEPSKYDPKMTDIYSLGVTLFSITTCKSCFQQATSYDKFYRLIMRKKYEEFWQKLAMSIEEVENLSDDFKDLFIKMVTTDPDQRIKLSEILNHPWMANNDYPTEMEYLNEFSNRKSEVFQQKQLDILAGNSEEESNDMLIFKGIKDKASLFNNVKIKKFYNTEKNIMRNCIMVKGNLDPNAFMSNYAELLKAENKGELIVQPSEKSIKFRIVYNLKEDEEDNEDNEEIEDAEDIDIKREQLIIKVQLKTINDKDQFVLLFSKFSGDKMEFVEKVKNLKVTAKALL